ncbi:MAG: geranylgeranyl pyrophosphate synthase [Patescibacteria group bacterium]|nr:geranylgeranyl pyrophosphate synthase [Patescibacteria group bacterium]
MNTEIVSTEPSLANFKHDIDRELERLLTAAIIEAQSIDEVYVGLLEATRDTLLGGGKRLRPYLAYLTYSGLGGTRYDAFVPAAVSQELLHHFLLIHDDIIDRDFTRHGGLNVEGTYRERFLAKGLPPADALHYAESFALLAGNAACALGLRAVTDAKFGAKLKLEALRCMQYMLFEIMGGELMDVDSSISGGTISPERLLRICHYKTATYSFQAPLQFGAILAGAPSGVQGQLRRFGHSLGIAFQLADDLLGVYGDEAKLGKPVTSDLREGKQTLLIYHGFELASATQAKTLRSLWGNRQADADELAEVRRILRDCGAQAKTAELAATNLQESLATLAGTPIAGPAKAELERIARFCVEREY